MARQRRIVGVGVAFSGFTLVELLVVISIISMMMSILLPSLSRAREAGRRVDCFSNMRQLMFAWNFYSMDNEDRVPSPSTFWNDAREDHFWVADGPDWPSNDVGNTEQAVEDGVLWSYTQGTLSLYECKTDKSLFLRDYSISGTIDWSLDNIKSPSRRMVFVDASSSWKWIHDSYFPIKLCSREWYSWDDPKHRQQITARHSGGCNMSFADFHCEYFGWKDPRTVKFAEREISKSEASDDNPDMRRLLEVLIGDAALKFFR
ncbi:MAG: type II secretion system protein [Planctomycetota bacterium]|jgi:prepilin-type N-terminal cleavage/methylation domain-containing protein/prepilin-type processing-associated H-X9-DG protein